MFWAEVPFWEALESRRDSLRKVVFKDELVNQTLKMNSLPILKYALFKYRVLLLIVGVLAIVALLWTEILSRDQVVVVSCISATALVFYGFFCLIMVQAEMRYLLTPDILITMFCGVIPAKIIERIGRAKAD
jgi:hypothetical protein